MELINLKKSFNEIYGVNFKNEIFCFHSPGRVNLIGEHIDYNGGLVFPCALDLGIYGLVRQNNSNRINLASTNFDLKVSLDIDNIMYEKKDGWANYCKGVLKVMKDRGFTIKGMEILVSGDIPNGAGLSSSASLEVLIGHIVNDLFNDCKIPMVDIVRLCQKAENEFVGVNCGIMDQFAVGMGKMNKAILLDCNTLEYKYADLDLKDYTLVLMNTNKRRALNESKYNERRAECDEAVNTIKMKRDITNLCEISKEEFIEYKKLLKKDIIRNRAEHVIHENQRVKDAYRALIEGDLKEFGDLLVESHKSLKNLYEVTGLELDTIVEEALKVKECIGARMTGAGFGGCAIAIVKKEAVNDFITKVRIGYRETIGYEPSFYLSGIGGGTRKLS